MATTDTNTFHASCHCKTTSVKFTVPNSVLPLPAHFCHCDICRHTHGTLCSIHAPLPYPPIVDLSSFATYASSDITTRYFCRTCGAHMLDIAKEEEEEQERWYVAAAMVDAPEETWDFHSHFFLDSTKDGGIAKLLSNINGKKIKAWKMKGSHDLQVQKKGDWEPPTEIRSFQDANTGKLKARCHCGGVEFYISRPRSEEMFNNMPQTMQPKDKTKWYALHDVCTTCRLVSGSAIVSWVFPEVSHVSLADGSPYTPKFGTIKTYESSRGVLRTFCGTCGATVAYSCDDRPEMVDIGAGLLCSESGVRAEDWFEWRTNKCAYERDAAWKGVLGSLKEGLMRRGGEYVEM